MVKSGQRCKRRAEMAKIKAKPKGGNPLFAGIFNPLQLFEMDKIMREQLRQAKERRGSEKD